MSAVAFSRRASRATLLWFGGLDEPFLNPGPLIQYGDIIALRDARGDWYSGGIDDEPFETAVRKIAADARGALVCAGQSSGGYAALLAAHVLDAAACVAFAPQTANRPGLGGVVQPSIPIVDVAALYAARPPSTKVTLHIARSEAEHADAFFWDDWAHARPMLEVGATLVAHPVDHHALTLRLYGDGRLHAILAKALTDAGDRFRQAEVGGA